MRRIVTTLAAILLVAGAAQAQAQGNGRGGGQGGGNQAQGGGGKPDKSSRQGGGGQVANTRAQGGGNERGGEAQRNRGNGNASSANDRGSGDRGRNGNRDDVVDRGRGNDGRAVVIDRRDGMRGDVVRVRNLRAIPARGLVAGCPPGLAKKNPPCVPPGQVRGRYVRYDRPDFWGLRLGDGRYRYDNGYLLRLGNDGRIGSYIPLLGGALAIGNAWPSFYQPVALPAYYESFYGLGAYNSYRYADNVIYRVDPETAAITSVAALLTGDDFTVGQPMPVGYDVYNVPYAYRAQYVDGPTAAYRYADGRIYQLDPETRLIAAAIELLAT